MHPSALLAVLGVLMQLLQPLLPPTTEPITTIGSVCVLASAAVLHATTSRGPRWTLRMVGILGIGSMAAELIGTATGLPFGHYSYNDSLGPTLALPGTTAAVPLLIPLAWIMLGYPTAVLGQHLCRAHGISPRLAWIPAAWTLTAWDVFLDPQMVAAGHWTWYSDGPSLPGTGGIPLINYAGWLLVSSLLQLALLRWAPHPEPLPRDGVPTLILTWTYTSQVLANVMFFGRPATALVGGLAMGLTMLPYLHLVTRRATDQPQSQPQPVLEVTP